MVPVLDFDGQFEGKGVSKLGMASGDPEALLAALKKPKRPTPPRMPKLETFEAEQPEYAAECKFEDLTYPSNTQLWEKSPDSHGENDITYAAAGDELPAGHPCAVAAGAGGTEDNVWADGDGQTHDKLDYSAIFACSNRDIARGSAGATVTLTHELVDHVINIATASGKFGCALAPNMVAAPLGVGAEFQVGDACSGGMQMVQAFIMMAKDIWAQGITFDMALKGAADCDPLQTGLARLFCDIHCVRDAVIRGDRTINRNLQKATDITNRNLQKFTEWSVDSMMSQTDWLAEKIDYVDTKLGIKIDALKQQPKDFLLQAKGQAAGMMQELQGWGEQASRTTASKAAARRALAEFVASLPTPGATSNVSVVVDTLAQVEKLHSTLALVGRAGQGDTPNVLLEQGVRHMQQTARQQLEILGQYRYHGAQAKAGVRATAESRAKRQALVEMDKVWWQLREELDGYLDAAEEQVQAFQGAFAELKGYRQCSSGFAQITAAYNHATESRTAAHTRLRAAWRRCQSLVGELSAIIVDGDVFGELLAGDCESELAQQTMRQVRAAAGGMRMLHHRHEVGGLGSPDARATEEAMDRIAKSLENAASHCK